MTALGDRLRELRAGHKQSDVAELLECSPSSLSAWENGSAVPNIARLRQLADVYGGNFEEMRLLRERIKGVKSDPPQDFTPTTAVLQDIRYLLVQIRDELRHYNGH